MKKKTPFTQKPPPRPCPFCGLVPQREDRTCRRCKMELNARSLAGLKGLVGPWFVLDERNATAPGVTWTILLPMIHRGQVNRMSVVRGPTTGGLWRYAMDTPLLATTLGLCWSCHAYIPQTQSEHCPRCNVLINSLPDTAGMPDSPSPESANVSPARQALAEAMFQFEVPEDRPVEPVPLAEVAGPDKALRTLFVVGLTLACAAAFLLCLHWGHLWRMHSQPPVPASAGHVAPAAAANQDEEEKELDANTSSPASQAAAGHTTPAPVTISKAQTGELFPAVPSEPSKPLSAKAANDPPVPPTSLPAAVAKTPAPPDPQAGPKRAAQAMYNLAQAAKARGDLLASQKILIYLTERFDPPVRPFEATEVMQAVQAQIRATAQPEVSRDRLLKQWRLGKALYEQALAYQQQGKLAQSQECLLQIMSEMTPQAWPQDTLDLFQKVEEQLSN